MSGAEAPEPSDAASEAVLDILAPWRDIGGAQVRASTLGPPERVLAVVAEVVAAVRANPPEPAPTATVGQLQPLLRDMQTLIDQLADPPARADGEVR